MALSKLRELHMYETKMSETTTKCFNLVIKHGMFGDHHEAFSPGNPERQDFGDIDEEENIFHMAGSNGEKTAACRNFCTDRTNGLLQVEYDILLEIFSFDEQALGVTIQKGRPGFYYILSHEQVKNYLRGKHFNKNQAAKLIDCIQPLDVARIRKTFKEVFPWYDMRKWFPDDSSIERTFREGYIPPNVLKKAIEISTEKAQRHKGDPNTIFGGLCTIPIEWTFENSTNGPAVTTEIHIALKGLPMTLGTFSFDTVTCAKLKFWPDDATEFITRDRKWPNVDTVKQCISKHVQIVPKFSNVGDKNEWYLSFVVQERMLSEERTDNMKFTFYLFKILFYTHFKKPRMQIDGKEESLSSYIAKTTMMWACEELDPLDWTEEGLQKNLQLLIMKVFGYLESGTLPHYFIKEVNILENTPRELIESVVTSVRDCNLLSDPLTQLPTEGEIVKILNFQHMLYDFVDSKMSVIEDILRRNPWGFIPER